MQRMSILLLACLSMAGMGLAAAQSSALPADARFDVPVALVTGPDGENLAAMVSALARSVGWTPIVDDVPTTPVSYDISEPKPFRQVWDLLLSLNGLDFVVLDNDVVVVGTEASIAALRAAGRGPIGAAGGELERRFYRVNGDPAQLVAILDATLANVDVSALPGVPTIVAFATSEDHERIAELLAEFDAPSEVVEQKVYPLSNANAVTLASVLQQADIVVDTGDGLATATASFTVVADARTNSLIITGTPAVQASIAALIPELDVAQRQVNVQVRIQEINRRVASSLGIDLSGASGSFAANLLNTGLRFIFDAQAAVSGLNLAATLDALESQGLSRRVDDSTLTVLNNGTGKMQSGGRIEISFEGAEGQVATRTIEYGVIVTVTPRIASDGSVILDVSAEVSDVLVPLSEGGAPERIDFSTRAVSSTVTLQPGQTVLLGGLLQNAFSQSERRIPVLGDIPLLGALFGQTELEDESTELLLVVDATVLD